VYISEFQVQFIKKLQWGQQWALWKVQRLS